MKSFWSKAFTSVFIVVFLASCTKTVTYLSPNEAVRISAAPRVVVETQDGKTLDFRNPKVENQTIAGIAKGRGQVSLDYSSIKSVRIEKNKSGLAYVYGGAGLVLAWLIIGAATAPEPPPGSCPFIYSYDGATYHLDAEPFGASLCEGLKRAEWSGMEHLTEVDGAYRILVANDLPETEYVDEIRLLVIDHPSGLKVVPDAAGGLHAVASPRDLRSARDSRGTDITGLLSRKDRVLWQTDLEKVDPQVRESLMDELTLEFPKPAGAKTAKLLVNATTSLWGAYMGKRFLGLHGDALQDYYAEVDRHGPAYFQTMSWHVSEEMYLLQIRVLTANGWKTRGTIYGGGPSASVDKTYVVNVADVPGDTLTIRLMPPANFWAIDYLAVDYSADIPLSVTEVEPIAGAGRENRDAAVHLRATDGSYLVMPEGSDPVVVTFGAPPRPSGTERTVILKASGYYDVRVETAGVRPRTDILRRFAVEPGSTIRFAMEEYLEWKAASDANARPVKTRGN
jgi:hypothetical protein